MSVEDKRRAKYDGSGRLTPWALLGRLLPHSLRTRLFEPAYFDLLAEYQRHEPKRVRFGLLVLGLALDSYRVGAPRLAMEVFRSRSRSAWMVATVLGVLALVVALRFIVLAAFGYGPTE